MNKGVEINPLNAEGKYYIDQNICLACEDCFRAAPNNFSYNTEDNYGYYVCKQPETPGEEAQCRQAMADCPLEAVCDNGVDL